MRRKEREVRDQDIIEQLIRKCKVCRIALADNNIPYIVPLNFGYLKGDPSCFYFHCARSGKKIDIISRNNKVWFELDTDHLLTDGEEACDFSMMYSSVMGSGLIHIVEDEKERNSGLNCLMKQYTGKDNYSFKASTMGRTTILRLDIETISGKQVSE